MEIKESNILGEKGLFATRNYKKHDVIYTLSGIEYDYPTRETIYIGSGKHIYDSYGIYMNHSFEPTTCIEGKKVVALVDIDVGTELTFNYNENEIHMANPFYVGNVLVSGKDV